MTFILYDWNLALALNLIIEVNLCKSLIPFLDLDYSLGRKESSK